MGETMRRKQCLHDGDRSDAALQVLDDVKQGLTYAGWERPPCRGGEMDHWAGEHPNGGGENAPEAMPTRRSLLRPMLQAEASLKPRLSSRCPFHFEWFGFRVQSFGHVFSSSNL